MRHKHKHLIKTGVFAQLCFIDSYNINCEQCVSLLHIMYLAQVTN